LSLRYFGPIKVVKERVGSRRAADFVAFDCTSQEKAAHGHVVYAVQEVPFWAPFDAVFDTFCPGNDRCAVVRGAMQHNPQDSQIRPIQSFQPS
jgi:hypothetical protein